MLCDYVTVKISGTDHLVRAVDHASYSLEVNFSVNQECNLSPKQMTSIASGKSRRTSRFELGVPYFVTCISCGT